MPHYLVRYSLGENHAYVYPPGVARVVWRLAMYHPTEPVMVGETDAELETDERQVLPLTPEEAAKLMDEYQASYPRSGDLPDPFRLPPR